MGPDRNGSARSPSHMIPHSGTLPVLALTMLGVVTVAPLTAQVVQVQTVDTMTRTVAPSPWCPFSGPVPRLRIRDHGTIGTAPPMAAYLPTDGRGCAAQCAQSRAAKPQRPVPGRSFSARPTSGPGATACAAGARSPPARTPPHGSSWAACPGSGRSHSASPRLATAARDPVSAPGSVPAGPFSSSGNLFR